MRGFRGRGFRTSALVSVTALASCLGLSGCVDEEAAEAPRQDIDASFTADRSDWPDPPKIPDDFSWQGRYVVPDLGIEVPFVWNGNGGDFQMIAGGEGEVIHFTNLIVDDELYTLTYTWPGVPRMPCAHVGPFTLAELNAGLAEASFAGTETLHREEDYRVHHFRSVGIAELPIDVLGDETNTERKSGQTGGQGGEESGVPLRVPIMAGDVYIDADEPHRIRQLLHFGVQNLYDPNLDEWIVIDESQDIPGEVSLPSECAPASAAP